MTDAEANTAAEDRSPEIDRHSNRNNRSDRNKKDDKNNVNKKSTRRRRRREQLSGIASTVIADIRPIRDAPKLDAYLSATATRLFCERFANDGAGFFPQ